MSNFYEMLTQKPIEKPVDSKRAAWSRIQQQPELAQFLSDCKAEFGKPESIRITIEGEVVWKS